MKHNSLISANGFHTPIASTTVKSSVLTTIFKPLLLLLLLMVGSSAVWGVDYYVVGEGWTSNSENADWGKKGNNNFKMTKSGDVWYYKMNNISSSTNLQIKIRPSDDTDGWDKHLYYGANHDTQNRGNATLVESTNVEDKRRFAFQPSENSDVYLYTDGSQVWANAVPAGTATLAGHTVYLRGDLWQNNNDESDTKAGNRGWGQFPSCPTLTLAPAANEVASVSFLIPAVPSDANEPAKARFELYDNSAKKDVGNENVIVTGAGVSKAYSSGKITLTISKSANSHLIARQVNVHYSLDNKIRISVSDVTLSGDWYLYYDGALQSGKFTDATGSITINNVPTDNGGSYHSFFIAKSNSLAGASISHPTGNIQQGVVWLGGLFLDKAGSVASGGVTYTWENKQYKANSDGFSKYAGFSIKNKGDGRGAFKLSETSDVTFNLNNGVITLSAVASGAILPTDRTYDGTEYMFFHKNQTCTEGDHPSFDFSKDDARLYVHFRNASTSVENTPERAFFWDADKTILAVKVPAGTYKKFQIYRISRETAGWYEWNHSYELPLDYTTKNYLSATSTTAATWDTYTPPTFRFVLSGTAAMTGDNSDFAHWNGNGTVYTGSTTKDLNSGTYKFKINPAGVTTANNMWVNEFNWNDIDLPNSSNNINLRKGTDNGEIWFDLANRSQVTIACDGSKVTVVATPVQQYTVTFNTDEGSIIDPVQVSDGSPVAQPADPTKAGHIFSKWQLNGSDYNFSNPVTGNITLDAIWVYKAISSVVLNESTHMTWVGNTDFSLTPTLTPSDAIAKSVAWSSDDSSVATVSGGTVHAEGVGTATITCTVTDQFDTQRSASCEVTVAACQMIVDNLYSMTVTGYNTSTDPYATLSYLWNESSDNDGPASMTITRLAFQKKDAGKTLYAYDESGTVKVKEDVSGDDVQWILIPVGESYTPSWNSGNACPLYYIKNKATGAYMHRGSLGVSTGNPDWIYSVTNTNATNAATDDYKWFFVYEPGNVNQRCIFVKSGIGSSKAHSYKLHTSNQYNDCTDAYAPKPMLPVGCTADINDYAKSYNNTSDFNYDTYPNPNYKASLMNGSYYRMNTDATVRANLDAALVSGAVITVRLYADANTTVKLQKTDGTEIETVNLSADAEHEYSYTVAYGSELVGATAFIIKAADNHAGIASIVVTRTYAASPENPVLTWDDGTDVTQSALEPAFQRIASSTLSSGAIHYISSDETVATVAADGTVTPLVAGNTTITATIEAEGCYDISYDVTLTEPSLQEAIDATPVSGTLTLTHDYAGDAVINKAITIDGDGHSIGDLKIENTGDLTLSSGLTVRDFTICAKAGNTTTPAASGQVRNAATNLTCNRNAYFLYTVDPSDHVQYGWYDFTVPFPVNVMTGIKGIQDNVMKENFANEVDYAIMEYLGERKAQGQYPYQKFRGVMQPNQLYSITLDSRYNYNTVRFQKTADGALVADDDVTLHEYLGDGIHDNLNGVGNGTLHHADAGISGDYVQVYQSGEKTFLTVAKTQYSFVVGTAFMVQEKGTMTLSQATPEHNLLAPARQESAPATAIQIAREGQPFSDQLFISASETGGQAYTPGTDLAKAGDLGSANVPQIWTNAYNNPLCVHEAQLVNGEASYNLSIYAPAADTYTLTSQNIPADYSLYLTQNGTMLTELSGTYTLDLNKGITTEYGLLLVETYKTPTGMEEPMSQESRVKSQKILRGGVLYILHNGKVYNAQGGKVCDL